MASKETQIKLEGVDELRKKLDQLQSRVDDAMLDAARAGAKVIVDEANSNAPGPHVVMGNEQTQKDEASVDIGPDEGHWYYRFFETGATAHEIKAAKGSALAFEGSAGDVITRSVEHPGMPANPFLRPAMDSKQDAATTAAGEEFRREIDRISGGK